MLGYKLLNALVMFILVIVLLGQAYTYFYILNPSTRINGIVSAQRYYVDPAEFTFILDEINYRIMMRNDEGSSFSFKLGSERFEYLKRYWGQTADTIFPTRECKSFYIEYSGNLESIKLACQGFNV